MNESEVLVLNNLRRISPKLGYDLSFFFTPEIITTVTKEILENSNGGELSDLKFNNLCESQLVNLIDRLSHENMSEEFRIKARKRIVVNDSDEDEIKVSRKQYSTKDKYYLKDFFNEIKGQRITGKDEFDAMEKARIRFLPSLRRVARVVSLTKETTYVKNTGKDPFMPIIVDKSGFYGNNRRGQFQIKFPTDKGEMTTKNKGPFSLLHENDDLVSYGITNTPYHDDIGYKDSDEFNLFSGFKATFTQDTYEEAKEKCKPILDHIFNVIANKNINHYNYILEWFMYPIRELKRTNIMLVIIGFQGAGKSRCFDFLRDNVYGEDLLCQPSGLSSITEHFNALLINKMVICVDETQARGEEHKDTLQRNEELKALITGDKYKLTKKGIDSGMVANNISFACTTNTHIGCLHLQEDQRRVAMFETMDKKEFNSLVGVTEEDLKSEESRTIIFAKRKKYFDILSSTFTQEMGDAFYTMARRSTPLEKGLCNIPLTEILKENIDASKAKGCIFFDDILNGNVKIEVTRIVKKGKKNEEQAYISIDDLFIEYENWWKKTKNGRQWNMDFFSKQLKFINFFTVFKDKRIHNNKTTWIEFNKLFWKNIYIGRDSSSEGSLHKYITGNADDESSSEEVVTPKKKTTEETETIYEATTSPTHTTSRITLKKKITVNE